MKKESRKKNSGNSAVKRVCVIALFFLLQICFLSHGLAEGLDRTLSVGQRFPAEFGEVIYRCNEDSPGQIYIIGMSHRDTFTRKNSHNSIDSQIDVFRIAEWMVLNEGLELLLPEGFFFRPAEGTVSGSREETAGKGIPHGPEDLRKELERDSTYTNAEMVLMERYGMKSRQVEDEGLYNAVKDGITLLADKKLNKYDALYLMAGISYLQERRTAAMLQKVPGIVDSEFAKGTIKSRRAILTMGLDHIPEIIKYLENRYIAIHAPPFFDGFDDYSSELKLLNEGFGVTVIVPRSLSATGDVIRLTKLDHLSSM